jgi:hypothetical protein
MILPNNDLSYHRRSARSSLCVEAQIIPQLSSGGALHVNRTAACSAKYFAICIPAHKQHFVCSLCYFGDAKIRTSASKMNSTDLIFPFGDEFQFLSC